MAIEEAKSGDVCTVQQALLDTPRHIRLGILLSKSCKSALYGLRGSGSESLVYERLTINHECFIFSSPSFVHLVDVGGIWPYFRISVH